MFSEIVLILCGLFLKIDAVSNKIPQLQKPKSAKIMTDETYQNLPYVLPTPVPFIPTTNPPLIYTTNPPVVIPTNPTPPVTVPVVPAPSPFPTAPPVDYPTKISIPDRNGIFRAIEKCTEYHSWILKKPTFQFFIINGIPSLAKEFPHMAALGYGEAYNIQWLCGGSLISEQYVLTAAHCLSSNELGAVKYVRMGDTNLKGNNGYVESFTVKETIAHPEYSPQTKYNDIALIKLDRPVEFSEYVVPICLSTNSFDLQEQLIATGWGNTDPNGARSETLMKVNLDYFSNEECQRSYSNVAQKDLLNGVLADRQICAGSRNDDRDTCQGDSGGPLQIHTDKLYLIGITSIGQSCGKINTPAIYTNVYYYIPWLERIVWSN